jgi:hypothetical protein
LAEEVATHDPDEALKRTREYFDGKGNKIWEKLEETNKCFDKTHDQRRLNERLEMDVNNDDFDRDALKWIEKNERFYWNLMVNVDRMFEKDVPLVAGMFWAEFLECVARRADQSFDDVNK